MAFGALNKVRSVGLLAGSTSPIAIDFGIGSLKVLQIGIGEQNSLLAAACAEVPEAIQVDHIKRLEFQTDALIKFIKSGAFKGKRAMCAIPASQIFCKHLQFPKSDPDIVGQVQTTVPALLNCHPEALVYRHAVVNGVTGNCSTVKAEVICFAVPRELIRRVMDALRACKLEPVGIHPSALATMRGFDPITRREEDKNITSLYLDLGAGATTCLIAHGKEMVFAKTIHIGGRHLDEAAAAQLRCSLAWARQHRQNATELVPVDEAAAAPAPSAEFEEDGPGPLATIGSPSAKPQPPTGPPSPNTRMKLNLADQINSLTDEVSLCMHYHGTLFPGRRVDRVIFVGGEARSRLLCHLIAKKLRLSAQVADPLAPLARTGQEYCQDVDLKQPQPGWATALGLCLSPADL